MSYDDKEELKRNRKRYDDYERDWSYRDLPLSRSRRYDNDDRYEYPSLLDSRWKRRDGHSRLWEDDYYRTPDLYTSPRRGRDLRHSWLRDSHHSLDRSLVYDYPPYYGPTPRSCVCGGTQPYNYPPPLLYNPSPPYYGAYGYPAYGPYAGVNPYASQYGHWNGYGNPLNSGIYL